jgi:hypothetical protein
MDDGDGSSMFPDKYTLSPPPPANGPLVLKHLRIAEAEYVRAETELERYQAIAHYYESLSWLGRVVPIVASEAVGGG